MPVLSVDEYLHDLPRPMQDVLGKVRQAIKDAAKPPPSALIRKIEQARIRQNEEHASMKFLANGNKK